MHAHDASALFVGRKRKFTYESNVCTICCLILTRCDQRVALHTKTNKRQANNC